MAKYTTSSSPVAKQGVAPGEKVSVTGSLLAGLFVRFFVAWEAMLVIGAMHAELDSRIPAYGYWGVFFFLWTLAIIKSVFTYNATVVKS